MVIVVRKVCDHFEHLNTGPAVVMLDQEPIVIRGGDLMASPESLISRFTSEELDWYCAVCTASKPKDATGADVPK